MGIELCHIFNYLKFLIVNTNSIIHYIISNPHNFGMLFITIKYHLLSPLYVTTKLVGT